MEMNIGDMVAAMAARNEAFRGNEQVPEKVETYNKLKEHAAAIGKVLRAPWYVDDLELREQNTFVYIDFPLPVNILNNSIRGRIPRHRSCPCCGRWPPERPPGTTDDFPAAA